MPLFVAALIGGLIQALGTVVGRILVSLGVGFVAYQGISAALDGVKTLIVSNLQGFTGDLACIISMTQLDTAISILTSAVAARLVINGLQSGTVKRMVVK